MKNNRLKNSMTGLILLQFREFFPYYLGAAVSLVITHYIQSELPFLAKKLALLVEGKGEGVSPQSFFFLAVGIIFFRTASRLLFFYPARVLQKNLRVELLDKISAASPYRYKSTSDGQIFQVLSGDMEQVRALIGFALLQVGNIIIALMILVPKLFSFNSKLILALGPMLLAFVLFTIFVAQNRKYFKLTQDAQGEVNNFILETYSGKKTVKNYHAEKSFIELFDALSFKELWYFYKSGIGIAFSIPLIPLGVGASLLWGAYLIKVQDLGASTLILFSGFIFLFLEPLMFVSWIGVVWARTSGSWVRIQNLLKKISTPSEIERELLNKNENSKVGKFFVDYWGSTIPLNLKEFSTNVFVSETGHGKSYLLEQVAESLTQRGELISYVAQDPYLYNDTIGGNLFLGRIPSVEDRDLALYLLNVFGLSSLSEKKENILELEIGENGKRLSGGQKKRLALVRSLLSKSKWVIWDDPFSSVDLILEKEIFNKVKDLNVFNTKTIVLTSHRASTLKNCDHIIFFEKGIGATEEGGQEVFFKEEGKIYEHFKNQMV